MKSRRITCLALLALAIAPSARAQIYQTDFPPEEFRARWARVFAAIGADTVAVVQGAPLANGFGVPRQNNSIYYLSRHRDGRRVPGARRAHQGDVLYLPPRNERLERAEGKVLSAEDADVVKRLTGVDEVRSTAAMTRDLALRTRTRPGRPSTRSSRRRRATRRAAANSKRPTPPIAADFWDGRTAAAMQFVAAAARAAPARSSCAT